MFFTYFNDERFFLKQSSQERKGRSTPLVFFWLASNSVSGFCGKSQVLRTCCQDVLKQINTHIIAAAKENEVLKDQVGSPVERTRIILLKVFCCIHQKPGPKIWRNKQKKTPKIVFALGKPGGNISGVELC